MREEIRQEDDQYEGLLYMASCVSARGPAQGKLTPLAGGCQVANPDPSDTLVCGGAARLPGTNGGEMLVIELEVERASQSIAAVYVNPEFAGLRRLIESALVGRPITELATTGVTVVADRYRSPFRNAARAALLSALEAYGLPRKRMFLPRVVE
jgi:hypothetical protein